MKVFIPYCESSENQLLETDQLRPFIIEAYDYHLDDENTQNLDMQKVMAGTVNIKTGKTKEL